MVLSHFFLCNVVINIVWRCYVRCVCVCRAPEKKVCTCCADSTKWVRRCLHAWITGLHKSGLLPLNQTNCDLRHDVLSVQSSGSVMGNLQLRLKQSWTETRWFSWKSETKEKPAKDQAGPADSKQSRSSCLLHSQNLIYKPQVLFCVLYPCVSSCERVHVWACRCCFSLKAWPLKWKCTRGYVAYRFTRTSPGFLFHSDSPGTIGITTWISGGPSTSSRVYVGAFRKNEEKQYAQGLTPEKAAITFLL